MFRKKMTTEDLARIAHEVNRSYCQAIGDYSQPIWEDAPDWQKESAVNGVEFHLKNPMVTPQQSHQNWFNEKKEAGWTFGLVKDPEKKQHPCMVPFHELPQEQRVKDYLFAGVIDALKGEL